MKMIIEWHKDALLGNSLLTPLHPFISLLKADNFPTLQECNVLLSSCQPTIAVRSGKPLHFVPQESGKLSFEAQYEPRCYLKGEVPTRANNWHDLFNALVWMVFPKAKAAINERHYRALTEKGESGEQSQRGRVRDTVTLLDESGVIVACAKPELAKLLHEFKWKELFWNRRVDVQTSMGFHIFGHGLYEKALHPYVGMTGQGLILPVEQIFFTWPITRQLSHLDDLLANYLSAPEHCQNTGELSPVPLLGVPGWAAENENAMYYDNTNYFRTGRTSRAQRTPLITAPSRVAG